MVRIGIAGIGFMGMIHYLGAARLKGARVTAICSRDKKKLAGDWRGIRGNFGPPGQEIDLGSVKRYDDFNKMLADPEIDLIDVCTPTILHPRMAIAALQAGKHVLAEKAIALETDEADAMVAAAGRAGKLLMAAHVLPFFPEFAFAAQAIRGGKYGKLLGGHFKRVILLEWRREQERPAVRPRLRDLPGKSDPCLRVGRHALDRAHGRRCGANTDSGGRRRSDQRLHRGTSGRGGWRCGWQGTRSVEWQTGP
jgi:predicted dehydrogenase